MLPNPIGQAEVVACHPGMLAARVPQWICVRGAVTTTSIRMSAITFFQRTPKRLAAALAMVGTLAAGVAGGYAARYAHLPLPWLLGALLTITALSLAGAPVRLIPWGRPAGTIVVGASTGLQFTAAVVAKLVTLLPLIIGAAFISTIVGAVGGLLYMRLTGIDRTTAFFATVPGGVVETTNIAPQYGGHLEPIMVAQTTRVALIVVFAPFLVVSFAGGGVRNPFLATAVVPWLPMLALLAVSAVSATLLSRTRSPNAWLMAPLFLAAGASHLGLIEGRMPDLLLIAAQVVIGSALGAQFRPAFLTRLFGLLWASCVVVLFAAGSMALFAAAIAWLAAYPVPTMVLAMAPAGIAEMVLTGKVLGLDSTLIAGFQLMRIIIVLIWCRTALVLFRRVADRIYGKPPDACSGP
jgi:membrane AbrB-like protein